MKCHRIDNVLTTDTTQCCRKLSISKVAICVMAGLGITITEQAYADIGAQVFTDQKGSLHVMWPSVNTESVSTTVTVTGTANRQVTTTGSFTRIDSLPAGSYSVTISQNGDTKSYPVVNAPQPISAFAYAAKAAASTIPVLSGGNLDAAGYPEMSMLFRAKDASGNPILNLAKSEFTLTEDGVAVSDFDFRPPSSGDLNKIADVVVVFDDTGSMGGEIAQLKSNVESFAEKLVASGVKARFRLISYKDDANDGWSWTDDVATFKSNVASLYASGGAGWYEDGFEAINTAADYDFREGTQKVFLLVTDAPSWEGTDEYGKPTPTKAQIIEKLKAKGINLYAVAYNGDQYNGAGSITAETGGRWYPISGDFTEIVNDIGNTVGGAYQVAWNISDTKKTNIAIKLLHASGAEINYSYTRNQAPRVFAFPNTTTVTPGVDLSVKVFAKDPENDALKDAALLYREHREDGTLDTWKYVKPTGALGQISYFTIPGGAITGKGLDYYVWVSDINGVQGSTEIKSILASAAPKFKITKKDLDADNLVIDLEFENLPDGKVPKFFYQGSEKGIFTGTPEIELSKSDTGSGFKSSGAGKFTITLAKNDLVRGDGVVGVVQIIAKLGDSVLDGSKEKVDYPLAVDEYIKRNADTIILTNFSKMQAKGEDTTALAAEIQKLVTTTWHLDTNGIPQLNGTDYNMKPIVVDLGNSTVLNFGSKFQIKLTETGLLADLSNANAADIIKNLDINIDEFSEKPRPRERMYLILAGDNSIIPYASHEDKFKFGLEEKPQTLLPEGQWYGKYFKGEMAELFSGEKNKSNIPITYASDEMYRSNFYVGRLVGEPSYIGTQFSAYINNDGFLLKNKVFLNISGGDYNNKKYMSDIEPGGMRLGRFLSHKGMSTWKKVDHYHPKGIDGYDIINYINNLNDDGFGTGIVSINAHGNYNLISTGNPFLLATSANERDKPDISELDGLNNMLIMSNACHIGISYSDSDVSDNLYIDFPEGLMKKGLPIYIANTAYGTYQPMKGKKVGDKEVIDADISYNNNEGLIANFVNKVVDNWNNLDVVYKNYFINSYSTPDLARVQFYGIPNYRLGPAPAAKSSVESSGVMLAARGEAAEKVSATASSESASSYLKTSLATSSGNLNIRTQLNVADFYHYDAVAGRMTLMGSDSYDEYGRPILSFSVALPDGAEVTATTVNTENTQTGTYTTPISYDQCNSEGCTEQMLETAAFDDVKRVSSYIKDGKLHVSILPIQHNTATKEALLTTMLDVTLTVKLPNYIADSDGDGLPDYWESFYELDPASVTGDNGANGDPDGDNVTNAEEYAGLTDPLVNNAVASDNIPPGALSNLTATPRENGVDFSFTPPVDGNTVQVIYGTDPALLLDYSAKVDATSGKISINGLQGSTTYYAVARVYDAAGNISPASDVINFKTPVDKGPDLPANPTMDGNVLVVKHPTDADFNGFNLYLSNQEDMTGASTTFKSKKEGTETRIDLGKYLEDTSAAKASAKVASLFVKVAAVDSNNHEGSSSSVLKVGDSSGSTDPDRGDGSGSNNASGGGSMGILSLSALFSLLVARRFRRKR